METSSRRMVTLSIRRQAVSQTLACANHEGLNLIDDTLRWFLTEGKARSCCCVETDLRLERVIRELQRFEALIIDDLGYVQQSREEMDIVERKGGYRFRRFRMK